MQSSVVFLFIIFSFPNLHNFFSRFSFSRGCHAFHNKKASLLLDFFQLLISFIDMMGYSRVVNHH